MKNFKLLLSLILLFTFSFVQAETITWLGNSAAWDDPAQWDTGNVPTFNDDVIIPFGYPRLYAGDYGFAKSVHVQSSGYLVIYSGGSLEIDGAVNSDGLLNDGRVYVYGALFIARVSKTINLDVANGIRNNNYFVTYSASSILIKNTDRDAIDNSNTGYFYNRGTINIYNIGNSCIHNRDRFRNTGTIDIEANSTAYNYGIINQDYFRNYSSGIINIEGGGTASFGNTGIGSSSANLINFGDINLSNSARHGLYNSGNVSNYSGALIKGEHSGLSNIYNDRDSEITNAGSMDSYYANNAGLFNKGEIDNSGEISIYYSNSYAYRGYSGSSLTNSNNFETDADHYADIYVHGDIINEPSGIFSTHNRLFLSGDFTNNGMYFSYDDGSNHWIGSGGAFINNGAVEDQHGRFIGNEDNQQLIVAPITGAMQEGVPFANALNVTSLSNVTLGNWYKANDPNSAIAGIYDEANNEFTPNSNAVGLDELFIDVEINASGVSKLMKINIEGGISLAPDQNNSFRSNGPINKNDLTTIENHSLTAFPNPTAGHLQLKSPLFEEGSTAIQVFNNLGQMVFEQEVETGSQQAGLDLPPSTLNGVYLVSLIQEGKRIASKRIQVQKE